MNDDTSRFIIGDAVAAATEEGSVRKRRWFSRQRKTGAPLTHCENCGTALAGPYCSSCGQHAIDYRRSFGRVLVDALDSFLNWDSKFFETAWLLVVRPWKLTLAFIAGKRVRYVHPLRLYLLVSIAFFFGVHELAKRANLDSKPRRKLSAEEQMKVDQALVKLPPDAEAELRKAIAAPEEKKSFVLFETDGKEPSTPLEKWLSARAKEKIGEQGVNAKVFLLTLVSNLPAMMLCCIPLFAFVLKILYLFKRILYIDHLIYALHIHAFAYLAIMVVGFGSAGIEHVLPGFAGLARAALIITAIVLLFLSIRRVYRQGWFMTLFKFALGGFMYLIVLFFAIAATFFVTLALP
jgi:hypothetical protein